MNKTPFHGSLRAFAIVVAAGSGRRMGFDKVIAPLRGRPVVAWSLAAFQQCDDIEAGLLVCAEGRQDEFRALAAEYPKFGTVVAGGEERRDSVLNGVEALAECRPNVVTVHDAARPLVTSELISSVVGAAAERGAAVAAEQVSDSLHRAIGSGNLVETVSRQNLWAMQTPQAATYDLLRAALLAARDARRQVTDEISALIAHGVQPHAVSHSGLNFKITWPRDLQLAEAVLASRMG